MGDWSTSLNGVLTSFEIKSAAGIVILIFLFAFLISTLLVSVGEEIIV